jgi:hypothetical protein
MSRKSEFAGSYEKPAQMYLEWSSDEKCFKYWDNVEKVACVNPLFVKKTLFRQLSKKIINTIVNIVH